MTSIQRRLVAGSPAPGHFPPFQSNCGNLLLSIQCPSVGNDEASLLVDVTELFVSAISDDPVYANRLVWEYFARLSSQLAVARALTGIPAVQTEDEILSQFASTVGNATPTPVSPLMDQLWPLLGSTQAELIRSERSSIEIWSEFLTSFESLRGN
jgi:hypothetical protein